MRSCITCGMLFEGGHANDIALELPEGPVCVHDSKDGTLKTGDEIFDGGVEFFASHTTDGDRELAVRLMRKNMRGLIYWQIHSFPRLDGPQATDEEFARAMARL